MNNSSGDGIFMLSFYSNPRGIETDTFFSYAPSIRPCLQYLWGIETLPSCLNKIYIVSFQYLWGIETIHQSALYCQWIGFLQYLWGIETKFLLQHRIFLQKFLQYLWGIENGIAEIAITNLIHIALCVPMRNWNIGSPSVAKSLNVFTVPMRNWNKENPSGKVVLPSVFTVPMRNWNNTTMINTSPFQCVFTVPMRNWNS